MRHTTSTQRVAALSPTHILQGGSFPIHLLAVLLLVALAALPQAAYAKSYRMPAVDIAASVEADGSLHVVEERSFDFDGSFTCVWWEFDKLEPAMGLQVNGVKIAFPDSPIPEFGKIEAVPFETAWRSSGGPGGQAYAVDEAYHALYVFFEASDTNMTVQIDYTVKNAVHLYEDCAELYWQYIGPGWAQASRNISCSIDLPANGRKGVAGDTVRAWGHGPLEGTVSLNDDASQVRLDVPYVSSGEFAEARVVFPTDWLSSAGAGYANAKHGPLLPSLLEEEQREADAANRQRMVQTAGPGLFGLASLCAVIWAAIMFFRHGREHKPRFTDQYWRDVPNKQAHPTAIARLMRWNRESPDDAVTTIMHLANLGAVSVGKGSYEQPAAFGRTKTVEDYYLTLNAGVAERLVNPVDQRFVRFLFGDVAAGRPSLWLSEIGSWGKDHPESFAHKMQAWQNAVTKQVSTLGYFEEQGARLHRRVILAAVLLPIAGLIATVIMENLLPLAFTLLGGALMAVFGVFMPRRTQLGADDHARAIALRNWLSDFTLLDERVTTDVKVWGAFMVYAQMFGIAKKVVAELRNTMPQIFAADDALAESNPSYVSWHALYEDKRAESTASRSFADSFERTFSNTVASVRSANAASNSSDGSGGGGGFSGGGGGGFGGGGGGAR